MASVVPTTLLEDSVVATDLPRPKGAPPRPLPTRWRMLAILSANICASYLPWYTFVPIMSQSKVVYNAMAPDLNILCILYSVVYVPGVFVTGQMLTNWGCHRCFVLATGLLSIGCTLRCGGPTALMGLAIGQVEVPSAAPPFMWLAIGQGLCALGQTFLVNATSHLAAEWFPPEERPAAAMISNLMNFVGGCLSFVVPTCYVSPDVPLETARAQVADLLLVQLKVALAALAVTTLLYRDVPSEKGMSIVREPAPLFVELWQVFSLRDFWLVNGHFVLYLTVLNTFDAIEGALLVSYGYSEAVSSWTAIAFCISSILSTAIESAVIKHPAHYRRMLISINGLLAVSCLLGLWCLRARRPEAWFVGVVGIMGFCTPAWGCSLEMGSEVCYPAREATVSSLLEAFGSVASVGGIVLAQWLIDTGCAAIVLVAMAAGSLSGGVALMGLSGRLHRHEAEEAQQELFEVDSPSMASLRVDGEVGAPKHRRAWHLEEPQCV